MVLGMLNRGQVGLLEPPEATPCDTTLNSGPVDHL